MTAGEFWSGVAHYNASVNEFPAATDLGQMQQTGIDVRTALVLPGGGARGAFQVGVLKALAELLPRRTANPFRIISGTSAGAINTIVLASRTRKFRTAVLELDQVWRNFRCQQVYRTDHLTMLKIALHWFSAVLLGGWFVGTPRSLLDNSPLRALLRDNIHFPRIRDAVAVTAAGYASARSTSFFQGAADLEEWSRTRHVGRRSEIELDHIMASAAVPFIFPPVRINNEYYGDGAMRQATPLSPAVHLGADRILVIGIRDETGDPEPTQVEDSPTIAQIAGYMLDTLFMDGLYTDLERITRINELVDLIEAGQGDGTAVRYRPIDTMLIVPSRDLREIAHRHRKELPLSIRALLRGVGGSRPGENRLLSYLLFEQAYTRELIDLGYHDAMSCKQELLDFVTGREVPRLFAPSWISKDLSGL